MFNSVLDNLYVNYSKPLVNHVDWYRVDRELHGVTEDIGDKGPLFEHIAFRIDGTFRST